MSGFVRQLFLLLIKAYQVAISPWLAPSCRFVPSCSEYAAQAIQAHGPWRGAILAVRRLGRCHPWGGSGLDEIPAPRRLRTRGDPAGGQHEQCENCGGTSKKTDGSHGPRPAASPVNQP